jgi:NTE family protein
MIMMKLGLVLSGGGVRGIAHIGAIKALEEHDIHPTIVSGSSAGAVVGALYCGGFSTDEMMGFFKLIPLFHLNKFAFKKPGFIDTDKFYADFKKYFREDDFESLEKSLSVTSVDILSGQLKVFEAGELIKPLLASCAFPGLFSPVLHKNVLYADGGILDNFPTIPIKDKCDKLIGVYASPLSAITPDDLKYSVSVLERAIKINYSKRSYLNFRDCDILIRPMKLVKYGLLDVSKMQEIYDIGYDSTNEQLEEISTDDLRRFHS